MAKRFAVFISILVTVLSLANYLVLLTASFFLGQEWPQWILIGLALLMPVLFVLTNFLAFRFYNWFSRLVYILAVLWLSIFLYCFFAAFFYWVLYDLGLREYPAGLGYALYALAGGLVVYGILNANHTRVTRINISLPNLPDYWAGRKILFLSDMHFGQVRNINFARKLVRMINELKPELVLIGGDMFDGGKAPAEELSAIFETIHAPQGIYFVTGNHEEFTSSRENVEALRRHGIRVLDTELVNLNGLQVAGVDYLKSASTEGFEDSLQPIKLDPTLPSILIKHVPNRLNIPEEYGFSLQLSGHTHLGQVFPGKLFTRRIFKGYDYGLKKFKRMQVYTSSGSGTWGPPMRVATVSEIVFITLQKS